MTNPITPPPKLVQEWVVEYASHRPELPEQIYIATRAAQWGADMELEACCEWLSDGEGESCVPPMLRTARRPKPPSLKEQALTRLDYVTAIGEDKNLIRLALEALPDD